MIKEKYINLFTDFGFKRVFGSEANKDILIDFLNQVLPEDYQIQDLSFTKNEYTGVLAEDRKAVFDLHCTSSKGERFIVELQKAKQQFFKDRSIYYATFPIAEQAERGEWNYKLEPVFLIGILNFAFADSKADDIRHHIQLKNQHCEVFYEKLHFIYLEVIKFNKTLQACENRFEKWLWIFKNLPEQEEMPEGLMNDMLSKVFKIAEVAKMSREELAAYEQSLKYLRDLHNVVDTAFIEGEQIGLQKGREEGEQIGLEKGKLEGVKETARKMIEKGMDISLIAEITGLSIEQIQRLK